MTLYEAAGGSGGRGRRPTSAASERAWAPVHFTTGDASVIPTAGVGPLVLASATPDRTWWIKTAPASSQAAPSCFNAQSAEVNKATTFGSQGLPRAASNMLRDDDQTNDLVEESADMMESRDFGRRQ